LIFFRLQKTEIEKMSDTKEKSIALFEVMDALTGARVQLQDAVAEACGVGDVQTGECFVSILRRAMLVAHAACEAALTRLEPMYDAAADLHETEEIAFCDKMVESTLQKSNIVVSALVYASTQCASWLSSLFPLNQASLCCGETAMHAAIEAANIGAVALGVVLLQELRMTPSGGFLRLLLLHALNQKEINIHVFRILLSSSELAASIGDRDDDKHTALMNAARWGHAEAVTALLTCPAVVASAHVVDDDGDTALILASRQGHTEAVMALLTCPVVASSAAAANHCGHTALMLASVKGHTASVRALLACPAVAASAHVQRRDGNTALMMAAINGHAATVTVLLTCPVVVASADTINNDEETALILATQWEHPETVAVLLTCPVVVASAGVANCLGNTALMIASSSSGSTVDIVCALLGSPSIAASADAVDAHGNTALMRAAISGNAKKITALLTCSQVAASSGSANSRGYTALMIASLYGFTEVAAALHTSSDDMNVRA
jgi:ankyrin repeat protein